MLKRFFKLQSDLFGMDSLPVSLVYKLLLKGTTISLLRNPATSILKGISMIRNRGEMIAKPVLKLLPDITDETRPEQNIENVLDEMGLPAPVPGSLELLIDGDAFFPDLHEKVKQAETSVDTRVFIFDNDDVSVAYADLLKEKSKNLRCRVLLDHLGSITAWFINQTDDTDDDESHPKSMAKYLADNDNQIQVRRSLNPFFVADHSKLIVIDEKIAYLGGMNIGREYRYDWHDMMVRLEGPVVSDLQSEYNRAWGFQGNWGDWTSLWRKHERNASQKNAAKGEIGMRILATRPFKNQIESALIAAVKLSQKRLYIQNAYFTSDIILEEMIEAKKRGVDVRMIFPCTNDSEVLEANNESVTRKLLEHDILVYEYPRFSHIKAIVSDDWAMLGSANLDTLSLRINEELNIAFSDPDTVERLVTELFEADFENSKIIEETDSDPITGTLIEALADQL